MENCPDNSKAGFYIVELECSDLYVGVYMNITVFVDANLSPYAVEELPIQLGILNFEFAIDIP